MLVEEVAMEENYANTGGGGGGGGVEYCSEDELAVLPRHTKVVITGNNRTKSLLVGLQGVVKKAVGLGGWHWLVLTNGIEVKLQRNALSVIETPTGNEEHKDLELESHQPNVSYLNNAHKSHRSRHRALKSMEVAHNTPHEPVKVDLGKLEMTALRKYWCHFNLMDASPNLSKDQIVDVVQRHFMSQKLDELQVIVGFAQAAKKLKSTCK